MQTVATVADLRQQISLWKSQGERIVLVPTMGNLHEGHLALVRHAARCGSKIVCTIFVNSLQFDRQEDLAAYPRTPREDLDALRCENTDLVFMPEHAEVYAEQHRVQKSLPVNPLYRQLCGEFRPGFFDGVAEVVSRLFHMADPDVAVFGEKDYQQLLIIKQLVRDLGLAIEIEQVPTQREHDGLAFSSRNAYLDPQERAIAPQLYAELVRVGERIKSGLRTFSQMESQATERLQRAGFRPDYVAIRDAETLENAAYEADYIVILAAAWLGKARLIDNILVRSG
ncbi:MAG: pantoate--beta-alanine ligase [Proteobacteria bacterium]|nr:pantoate--beta-alanine ligase [Pseudomonadota bacterium]